MFDVEHALSDLRRHDVAVVAIGDRSESIRLFDTCAFESFHVSAIANNLLYVKAVVQARKRVGVAVNHRNSRAIEAHQPSQFCADAPAAYDYDIHESVILWSPPGVWPSGSLCVPLA
jgi:hypothetical protein